jgi:hypothetical protein
MSCRWLTGGRFLHKIGPNFCREEEEKAQLAEGLHQALRVCPTAAASRWCPAFSALAYVTLVAAAVAVIGLGVCLEPDARGHGTHEQLGLPPCPMIQLTGYPCPTCGFTTSLAHMARLQLGSALAAHILGASVFLIACGLLLWTALAPLMGLSPTAALGVVKSAWGWGWLIGLFYASWFVNIAAVAVGLKGAH